MPTRKEKEIVKEVVFDRQGHIILLSKKKKSISKEARKA